MIEVEIDDRVYAVPESYDDITFGQYCRAWHGLPQPPKKEDDPAKYYSTVRSNEAKVFSRLIGGSDNLLLDVPLSTYNTIANMLSFVGSPKADKMVKGIVIDGVEYSIIDLNTISLRRWIDMENVATVNDEDTFVTLLAIVLTPRGEGKKDSYMEVDEVFVRRLKGLRCSDVLPLLAFFFSKGQMLERMSMLCSEMDDISHALRHTTLS